MTDMLDQTANVPTMTTDELWAVTTQVELTSTPVEPADELWAPAGPSGRPPISSTVLPPRPGPGTPPPVRRPLGKISRDEVLVLCGALFSSFSITLLFFGRLLPLDGRLGFAVVWFAVFLVIYGLLVSITDNRPAVVDRVMAALMTSSAGRRRAAARPRQPPRGPPRGTRGTTVANGVACRAPHGPSGPRHLGHPRCGTGIGETAPVLLVSGITGSIDVNPPRQPDDVAAVGDVRVHPLSPSRRWSPVAPRLLRC